jgi:transposase-like protein
LTNARGFANLFTMNEPRFVPQLTLAEFDRLFPNEEACRTYLFVRRFAGGVRCPRCSNAHVYASKARPWHWQCMKCGPKPRSPYRFALTTGTIFEETKKPLLQWFKVLHLMLTSKKGISALQIHRMLGYGSYKTSWYMCMRLRASLHDPDFQQLMGIVEVDEMYHGGKAQNMHAKKRRELNLTGTKGKAAVIGAISRKGSVVCQMIENTDTVTLDSFVRKTVNRERLDLIATDEHSGYRLLGRGGKPFGLPHEFVTHSAGEYVRGIVHTNSIESFWSLFKRGVMGSYHSVSKKYLPLYLAEFQFRFNNRKEADIFGKAIAGC